MKEETRASLQENLYSADKAAKKALILPVLTDLTAKHARNCKGFQDVLDARSFKLEDVQELSDLPFLPVRLFKMHEMKSVSDDDVFKVLTSSGTTGQAVSRIVLDRTTAQLQSRIMVNIMQEFLGKARLPMLVIDHPGVLKSRTSFSARGAGILGMLNFGRKPVYALKDEDMSLDVEAVQAYLEKHSGETIFIFGFTFMVWKYFIKAMRDEGIELDLSNAVLVHSGGWKKLEAEKVSNKEFKATLESVCGLKRVHNFYGMVEQTGSIFVECEAGHLHSSVYSDIIIRDPFTHMPLPYGEKGIVQVLSVLPESYPGHSLLTEDLGVVLGEDDCACGFKGKYFEIHGRLPKAEVRGCSDTYEKPTVAA